MPATAEIETRQIETHAVQFASKQDAQRFVRVIRRRGWNARRKGDTVYVAIGMRASLDLLVKQWAVLSGRSPHFDDYTIVA